MQKPDDLELKEEIQAISGRINRILKEVKKHYSIAESDAEASRPQPASTETI